MAFGSLLRWLRRFRRAFICLGMLEADIDGQATGGISSTHCGRPGTWTSPQDLTSFCHLENMDPHLPLKFVASPVT